MKTNKEIIKELTDYFMKQPQELVCKMLAGTLVDLNRLKNIDQLEVNEKLSVLFRLEHNLDQLHEFIENGSRKDLKVETINFDE